MQSSAKSQIPDSTQSGRSLIKRRKSRGPKTIPCGTPLSNWMLSDVAPSTVTSSSSSSILVYPWETRVLSNYTVHVSPET